jgi:hypothetical protein
MKAAGRGVKPGENARRAGRADKGDRPAAANKRFSPAPGGNITAIGQPTSATGQQVGRRTCSPAGQRGARFASWRRRSRPVVGLSRRLGGADRRGGNITLSCAFILLISGGIKCAKS